MNIENQNPAILWYLLSTILFLLLFIMYLLMLRTNKNKEIINIKSDYRDKYSEFKNCITLNDKIIITQKELIISQDRKIDFLHSQVIYYQSRIEWFENTIKNYQDYESKRTENKIGLYIDTYSKMISQKVINCNDYEDSLLCFKLMKKFISSEIKKLEKIESNLDLVNPKFLSDKTLNKSFSDINKMINIVSKLN